MQEQTITIIIDENRDDTLMIFSGYTGYSGKVCSEAAKPIIDAIGTEQEQPLAFGEVRNNHHKEQNHD